MLRNYIHPLPADPSTELTLLENTTESILLQLSNVGLYFGKIRSKQYDNGSIFLTSHRICFLDSVEPSRKRLNILLSTVERFVTFAGFLQSSPKVTLYFLPLESSQPSNLSSGLTTVAVPATGENTNLSEKSVAAVTEWNCNICGLANQSTLFKCQLCGVKRPNNANLASLPISTATYSPALQPSTTATTVDFGSQGEEEPHIVCPICTFKNHLLMDFCELCEAPLYHDHLENANNQQREESFLGELNQDDEVYLRISFRGASRNSLKLFATALRQALEEKAWLSNAEEENSEQDEFSNRNTLTTAAKAIGGLSGIMFQQQVTREAEEENLRQGFKDLETLTKNALEMLKMVENTTSRLKNAATNDEETLSSNLRRLGLNNPVTKESSVSLLAYHQQLTGEIFRFLQETIISSPYEGVITLPDAYCLYNRARGIALVSPLDFLQACKGLEVHPNNSSLNALPLQLKLLQGYLVITMKAELDVTNLQQKLFNAIKTSAPCSVLDLSKRFNRPLMLIQEQVDQCETSGLICRDETIQGVFYYENLISLH